MASRLFDISKYFLNKFYFLFDITYKCISPYVITLYSYTQLPDAMPFSLINSITFSMGKKWNLFSAGIK